MGGLGNNSLANHNDNLAGHIVAALAPCQYEGLLSRHAIDDICRSRGGSLPAAMTSLFGFECQLGQEEPAADFLVRIGAAPEEWPVLEQYTAGQDGEIWRRIESLLCERAQPGSPLAPMLQNLWLEYDLIHPMNTVSDPSVFFGTERLTRQAETAWAVELVGKLRGEPLSDASRDRVNELVAVLPEAARLFQVGIMCSRPRAPLRVCVIGQEFAEVCGFLAAAHWPGELPRVAETLEVFMPLIDHAALNLDILDDGRLAPKLGIELYQKPNEDIGPRMIELVRRLSDGNLCTPRKATGLLAWGGITHERLYPDLWPAALTVRRALRGGGESSTFCRWLHHIKVVLEPDTPPIAKAYLAVGHAFLADSAIREALQRATLAGEKRS
jgi:hypothetical protein